MSFIDGVTIGVKLTRSRLVWRVAWHVAGGEENGPDHGQRALQHEHGRAGGEARTVPRHGDAVYG